MKIINYFLKYFSLQLDGGRCSRRCGLNTFANLIAIKFAERQAQMVGARDAEEVELLSYLIIKNIDKQRLEYYHSLSHEQIQSSLKDVTRFKRNN